ncbi:hypothetical protein [Bacillus sp. FJAT-28004]|uniref:hypothetical protein n=1 Tax=Bacillus sp. FJAT-28004 TaxID=1679165 RepID=UPI000AD15CD4|nr:hypothetical protein [Bacillus sp. FJAT-28004]
MKKHQPLKYMLSYVESGDASYIGVSFSSLLTDYVSMAILLRLFGKALRLHHIHFIRDTR